MPGGLFQRGPDIVLQWGLVVIAWLPTWGSMFASGMIYIPKVVEGTALQHLGKERVRKEIG